MARKERAIEFIRETFGEATAAQIADLDEEECITIARMKIAGFLGNKKAAEFNHYIE